MKYEVIFEMEHDDAFDIDYDMKAMQESLQELYSDYKIENLRYRSKEEAERLHERYRTDRRNAILAAHDYRY